MTVDTDSLVNRISSNKDFKRLEQDTIKQYVLEAIELVKQYGVPESGLKRAVYLYTCHMLYTDFPNQSKQYKTVKVENATYTRFGDTPNDTYWAGFTNLLDEYGLIDWQVEFK